MPSICSYSLANPDDSIPGGPYDPVVQIRYVLASGRARFGSGFLVSNNLAQTIVTAAHVVEAQSGGPATRILVDLMCGGNVVSAAAASYAYTELYAYSDVGFVRLAKPVSCTVQGRLQMPPGYPFEGRVTGFDDGQCVSFAAHAVTCSGTRIVYAADVAPSGLSGGPLRATDDDSALYGVYSGSTVIDGMQLEWATLFDQALFQACYDAACEPTEGRS